MIDGEAQPVHEVNILNTPKPEIDGPGTWTAEQKMKNQNKTR